MIRRSLRFGVRLGLLAGIALALFKLVQGRRAADLGTPSNDWATPPPPGPTPGTAPEPELVKPVMLEEVIQKKMAAPLTDDVAVAPVPAADPVPPAAAGASVVKKTPPVKKASGEKAPPVGAAAPVEEAAAPKKAAPKKAAAPVKKGPKKSQP